MNRNIITLAIAGLLLPSVASAATVSAGAGGFDNGYATAITYDDAAARGTSNDRANPLNALGMRDGKFFEIGLGSSIDLFFGKPFDGSVFIVEVTFGDPSDYVETVDVEVGVDGNFFSAGTLSNADVQSGGAFSLNVPGGPFDTLRLIDNNDRSFARTGGFDVDSVRVSAVPLPAAGLMLLGALGGVAALRRKGKKA